MTDETKPMSPKQQKRHALRLRPIAANVDEYVRSYVFALTDHDAVHQEHFQQQALAWTKTLLAELERKP